MKDLLGIAFVATFGLSAVAPTGDDPAPPRQLKTPPPAPLLAPATPTGWFAVTPAPPAPPAPPAHAAPLAVPAPPAPPALPAPVLACDGDTRTRVWAPGGMRERVQAAEERARAFRHLLPRVQAFAAPAAPARDGSSNCCCCCCGHHQAQAPRAAQVEEESEETGAAEEHGVGHGAVMRHGGHGRAVMVVPPGAGVKQGKMQVFRVRHEDGAAQGRFRVIPPDALSGIYRMKVRQGVPEQVRAALADLEVEVDLEGLEAALAELSELDIVGLEEIEELAEVTEEEEEVDEREERFRDAEEGLQDLIEDLREEVLELQQEVERLRGEMSRAGVHVF